MLSLPRWSSVVVVLKACRCSMAVYPILSDGTVRFTVFALFMGVSMSVTAFPVLSRILTDRRLQRTEMGVTALTCAAVDDVTAWCLLALVVLNIGLDLKVISPTLFAMLVVMALVTTFSTTPVLHMILRRGAASVVAVEARHSQTSGPLL